MSIGGSFDQQIHLDVTSTNTETIDALVGRLESLRVQQEAILAGYVDGKIKADQYTRSMQAIDLQARDTQKTIDQLKSATQAQAAALANAGASGSAWARVMAEAADPTRRAAEQTAALGKALQDYAATTTPAANASRQAADATKALADYSGLAVPKVQQLGLSAEEAGRRQMAMNRLLFLGSQALQDVQYGIHAVSNNLPMLALEGARAFGGNTDKAMQFGAAVGMVGVVLEALTPMIKRAYEDFAGGDYAKAHSALETIQHQLEKIKSEQWIVHVDHTQVLELEEAARRAKVYLEEVNRARGEQTIEASEAGRRVHHAVVESAGGTDKRSGVQNLAEAVGAYRDVNPDLFVSDKGRLADIAKLQKEADSYQAQLDAGNVGESGVDIQHQIARRRTRVDEIRKAMRADDEGRIGGALHGNETYVADLQRIIGSNPEFFAKRGIGERFRREIDSARREVVGADPEVRERLAKATPEGRRQHEDADLHFRNLDKANKDQIEEIEADRKRKAAKAKEDERERQRMNEEGFRHERETDALVERQRKQAEREREQAIGHGATVVQRALGRDKRRALGLDRAIGGRLDSGQAGEEIVSEIGGQLAGQLGNMVPAEQVKAVAEKVVKARLDAVAAQRGVSGVPGAGGMLDATKAKLDRTDRNAALRADREEMQADIARRFAGAGANQRQSLAMASHATRLIGMGLDFDRAMLSAWNSMQQQFGRLEQQQRNLNAQLQRTARRGNNNHRGNNFPNRTD